MTKNKIIITFFFTCLVVQIYFFYFIDFKRTESFNNYSIKKISQSIRKNVKIFCLIKTHPKNIKSNKTLTVYNVWARKCDNYRFVTLIPKELAPEQRKTNETFEIYEKFFMIQPKGLQNETHERLSLKVYYAMLYVYEKFPKYDWYYIVDDDAYANIQNFKEFLQDKNPEEAITFGYVIKLFVSQGYHSGGPGYVLSNEAFVRVGKALKKDIKNCPDSGIDDVDVNACVRKYNGKIGFSCDNKKRDRFLVMNFKAHLNGEFPSWMKNFGGCNALKGIDCCADSPIAFHYMTPQEMIRMDKAIEIQKNKKKSSGGNSNSIQSNRFRDIAKNYLLLEDIELNTTEYQKYFNI